MSTAQYLPPPYYHVGGNTPSTHPLSCNLLSTLPEDGAPTTSNALGLRSSTVKPSKEFRLLVQSLVRHEHRRDYYATIFSRLLLDDAKWERVRQVIADEDTGATVVTDDDNFYLVAQELIAHAERIRLHAEWPRFKDWARRCIAEGTMKHMRRNRSPASHRRSQLLPIHSPNRGVASLGWSPVRDSCSPESSLNTPAEHFVATNPFCSVGVSPHNNIHPIASVLDTYCPQLPPQGERACKHPAGDGGDYDYGDHLNRSKTIRHPHKLGAQVSSRLGNRPGSSLPSQTEVAAFPYVQDTSYGDATNVIAQHNFQSPKSNSVIPPSTPERSHQISSFASRAGRPALHIRPPTQPPLPVQMRGTGVLSSSMAYPPNINTIYKSMNHANYVNANANLQQETSPTLQFSTAAVVNDTYISPISRPDGSFLQDMRNHYYYDLP